MSKNYSHGIPGGWGEGATFMQIRIFGQLMEIVTSKFEQVYKKISKIITKLLKR